MSNQSCYDYVSEILELGEIDFEEDESHKTVAKRLINQGKGHDFALHTLRTKIGEWRRENRGYSRYSSDDSEREDKSESQGDSTDEDGESASDYDTWQEWADAETNTTPSTAGIDHEDDNKHHNKKDDVYVLFPKNRSGKLVIPGELYRSIREDYSNWTGDAHTINEICRTHGILRSDFIAIKRSFNFTHDDGPFTDAQLTDPDVSLGDLEEDLAKKHERDLKKRWDKRKWKQTENKARKWDEFSRDVLLPVYRSIKKAPIEERPYEYPEHILDDFYAFPFAADGHLDQLNADGSGLEENKQRWLGSLNRNMQKIQRYGNPKKVVLTLGNDQSNTDDPRGMTTNGTDQDQSIVGPDGTFKVLNAGVEAIEVCRPIAPVEVRVVPGNHDWQTMIAYYWGLREKYKDVQDVTIKGGAQKWQFGLYGSNLIGWNHGDDISGGETKQNWYLSSQIIHNAAGLIADATHCYFLMGHKHHILEKQEGVHTLQGGSTAKDDQWHRVGKHGASHPCQTAYIFAEDGGQTVRFTSYPDKL